MNCEESFFFEGVSSDDRIVLAMIRLSLHRNKRQISKTSRYDWSSFINSDIRSQYTVTGRNMFDNLLETSERYTPNDEYVNFVTAHKKAVVYCIETKQLNVEFTGS